MAREEFTPYDHAGDRERIIMYTLFNGLTRNTSGYFASCVVFVFFLRVRKTSNNNQVMRAPEIKLFLTVYLHLE